MANQSRDSVERFSDRVDNYAKYRPRYPAAVLDCLRSAAGLTAASVIADIGAGTGLLTELLLQGGGAVYAVEPGDAMRGALEAALLPNARLHVVKGRSEATTLPDASIDIITAGQAFHWFEPTATRVEFQRILRPGGWVALIWNRRDDRSRLMQAYIQLVEAYSSEQTAAGKRRVDHKYIADQDALTRFFSPGAFRRFEHPNAQVLDWEGFLGRLLSTSYIPAADDPAYPALVEQARRIFDAYAADGQVRIEYVTEVNLGQF